MKSIHAVVFIGSGVLVGMLAFGLFGSNGRAVAQNQVNVAPEVRVPISYPVADGIFALGGVAVSRTFADQGGAAARVVSFSVGFDEGGAVRGHFWGMKECSAASADGVEKGVFTLPNQNGVGEPGVLKRARVDIRPVDGRMWGDVRSAEDLKIELTYVTH